MDGQGTGLLSSHLWPGTFSSLMPSGMALVPRRELLCKSPRVEDGIYIIYTCIYQYSTKRGGGWGWGGGWDGEEKLLTMIGITVLNWTVHLTSVIIQSDKYRSGDPVAGLYLCASISTGSYAC